ncbi:MAG: hypothetical protein H5U10_03630 [Desulfacinum sp.]|nr:hypothetical protein [Desulfacinum sp.]
MELSLDGHLATVSKDRTGLFDGKDPAPLSAETGRMLIEWLRSGQPAWDAESALARIARAVTLEELKAIWHETPSEQREAIKAALTERKAALQSETVTEEAAA